MALFGSRQLTPTYQLISSWRISTGPYRSARSTAPHSHERPLRSPRWQPARCHRQPPQNGPPHRTGVRWRLGLGRELEVPRARLRLSSVVLGGL